MEKIKKIYSLKKPRILFFTESFSGPDYAGLQAQLFEEINRLSQKINILVLTQEYKEQDLSNNIQVRKVSTISIPILKTLYAIVSYSIVTIQNRKCFDIVYTRYISLPWLIAGILGKKILGKKLIVWLGASRKADIGLRGNFFKPFLKSAIKNCDLIGSSSQNVINDVEKYLGKINEDKTIIFSQAVDTKLFFQNNKSDLDKNIITVSRIDPEKGLETIIEAISFVKKKFPDIKLKIIGTKDDESYFQKLQKLSLECNVTNNIEFVGPIPHNKLADWYNSSKMFVLTSKTEEQSIATLEAMSCGLPVVVTRVGALSDLVIDGENGYLLDQNEPEILAQRIISLLENDNLRIELGDKARNTIEENFNWESYIEKMIKMFEKTTTK